ncbi:MULTISPECIES: mechanosensitive ion channel family protein [Avibacterium]|uniref:Small-conductance mechanosensitive channel n=1 Tax=Avibacterium endocarditidis TaxID=380674 RepID=A0ABX4ZRX7_9PAST|nr:mechanosensitive ion channel domain-containing protein [Avibacterium endocarditidis]POY42264.1 mechanosensitive ion channel protein MscS [Avibacterium endocarditidis]
MTTENAQAAENTVDIQAQTSALIEKVHSMDMNTLLNDYVIPYGTKILLAIAIYIIGKSIARLLSRLLGKAVLHSTKDEMLHSFVSSISYFLFLLMVIIAALSQLGINTTSLVALIGAAGLAIGLALQNSLQNFAAGVMILIFKPFRKGDLIETGGVLGAVEQIGLLVLELRTADNKTVLIPNGKVFGDSITNYSSNATRRIDFIFDIAYKSNIEQAKAIVANILAQDPRVLKDPEPTIAVGALAANSVQLVVRPWVNTADYWAVHFDVTEKVKLAFDQAGIEIPFPQMNIHLPENTELKVGQK